MSSIPEPSYSRLRVVAKVALGFTLLGAFALGFRMLGTPDLMQLVLPQLHILQCVAYAIIVAFAVYLAIFEAVLRPLQEKRRRRERMAAAESGTFFPVPEDGSAAEPAGGVEAQVEGLLPGSRVLHWANARAGDPAWDEVVRSCAESARITRADASGTAVLRQPAAEAHRDEAGRRRPPRILYRVEVDPGVWSEVLCAAAAAAAGG